MFLIWLSSASAATFGIGPSGDYRSIGAAIADNTIEKPLVLELQEGYAPGIEESGGGVEIAMDLTLKSDSATVRSAPGLRVVKGASVTLENLSFSSVPESVYNPATGSTDSDGPFCALQVLEKSLLTGTGLQITPELSDPSQGGVCVVDSSLSLHQSSVSVNYLGTPKSWGTAAWAITLNESTSSFMGGVTLKDVDLSVGAQGEGGGVYISGVVNRQLLQISGGSFEGFQGAGLAGSAVYAAGLVDTAVDGTTFKNIEDTAVHLNGASNIWTDVTMEDIQGSAGGAFSLKKGPLFISGGSYTNVNASNYGALVWANYDAVSVDLDGLRINGAYAGAMGSLVNAVFAPVSIRGTRVCSFWSSITGHIVTDGDVTVSNSVFRAEQGLQALSTGDGLHTYTNNTFIDVPVLVGGGGGYEPAKITLVNNAIVRGDGVAGYKPFSEKVNYNLFEDLGSGGLGYLEPLDSTNLMEEALFYSGFNVDDCNTDPYPAPDSPLIDAGDPSIRDGLYGASRSDIGAFGGPDREGWEDKVDGVDEPDTGDTGDSGDSGDSGETGETGDTSDTVDTGPQDSGVPERPVRLSGGCGAGASLAGAMLLLPLLGLGRRRRSRR